MARKSKKALLELPLETIITVVRIEGESIKRRDMTYKAAKELLTRKNKARYIFYQQGFCSIKPNDK